MNRREFIQAAPVLAVPTLAGSKAIEPCEQGDIVCEWGLRDEQLLNWECWELYIVQPIRNFNRTVAFLYRTCYPSNLPVWQLHFGYHSIDFPDCPLEEAKKQAEIQLAAWLKQWAKALTSKHK